MNIDELLITKAIKPKEKTEAISNMLLDKSLSIHKLIEIVENQKDPIKATCIEAIEFATKINPSIADETTLNFVSITLTAKAPRTKWESAKVIGNIAHLFPDKLDKAIINLIANTEHEGTVVRWSAAFALGEILKMKTKHNSELISVAENLSINEEKNSIRNIYLKALKKLK
jgi:HEAT repeat protein